VPQVSVFPRQFFCLRRFSIGIMILFATLSSLCSVSVHSFVDFCRASSLFHLCVFDLSAAFRQQTPCSKAFTNCSPPIDVSLPLFFAAFSVERASVPTRPDCVTAPPIKPPIWNVFKVLDLNSRRRMIIPAEGDADQHLPITLLQFQPHLPHHRA